ncbi:MAG: hypothetical protein NTX05_07875, partial [Fusobacteria bacterium]|nr:hypothetical protein [Fusobacteriota bacterium]
KNYSMSLNLKKLVNLFGFDASTFLTQYLRELNVPLSTIEKFHKLRKIGNDTIRERISLLQIYISHLMEIQKKIDNDIIFLENKIMSFREQL